MDYTQFEEVKAGEKTDTKIIELNEGIQSDFRTDAYFEKITDASKEDIEKIKKSAALQVVTKNGAELVINLPANNRISPRSKLAMFKKTYADFPKVGMNVVTKTDENGFFRILLEST